MPPSTTQEEKNFYEKVLSEGGEEEVVVQHISLQDIPGCEIDDKYECEEWRETSELDPDALFLEYYAQNIAPEIRKVENEKAQIIKNHIGLFALWGMAVMLYVGVHIFIMAKYSFLLFTFEYLSISLVTFVALAVYIAKAWKSTLALHEFSIKETVLPRLIPFIGEYTYKQKEGIERDILDKGNILPPSRQYHAEHLITGVMSGLRFCLCDVHLAENGLGVTRKKASVHMQGYMDFVAFSMELPLHLQGKIVLMADATFRTSKLSTYFDMLKFERDKKFHEYTPADELFSKEFSVWCTKDDETEKVLTPGLFLRFMEIREAFEHEPIAIGIYGKHLVMLIDPMWNIFSTPIWQKGAGRKELEHFVHQVKSFEFLAETISSQWQSF